MHPSIHPIYQHQQPEDHEAERLSDLLHHIQDEFLEDLVDAHGHGLRVEAPAEAGPHQVDQVPRRQAALNAQLQPVVGKLLLAPAAAHGLRQPPQEIFNLETRSAGDGEKTNPRRVNVQGESLTSSATTTNGY